MLKIGEVARRAGVPIDTVRFYERRGLLPEAQRRASGYRELTPAIVDRIRECALFASFRDAGHGSFTHITTDTPATPTPTLPTGVI